MAYRRDKYYIGDVVEFDEEMRTKFEYLAPTGNISYKVLKVENIPYFGNDIYQGNDSNWDDMGHTQLLYIEGEPNRFSGMWFKPLR